MIVSEDSSFTSVPQPIRPLTFEQLFNEGYLSLFLYRKLQQQAGLRTVDDLCRQYNSIGDFVERSKGAGKRVINELLELFDKLQGTERQLVVTGNTLDGVEEQIIPLPEKIRSLSLLHLHRQKLISNILFNKLYRDARLNTVGDYYHQFKSVQHFKRTMQGVGERAIIELTLFLESLALNPTPYLEAAEREKAIFLPLQYNTENTVLENLQRVVMDVKHLLSLDKGKMNPHYAKILEYFFTDTHPYRFYSLEDVGALLQLTRERVRQLREDVVTDFAIWIREGKNVLSSTWSLVPELKDEANNVIRRLKNEYGPLITDSELKQFLEAVQIPPSALGSKGLSFLFDIYQINKSGKVETNFTKANFYILSPAFDYKGFLNTASFTIDILKEEVIPISREDLIIKVNKRVKELKGSTTLKQGKIPHHFFDITFSKIPEIEAITINGTLFYQLAYPFLSSITARSERILFELGGRSSIAEIIEEMKKKAIIYGLECVINEVSIRHSMVSGSNRIIPHGKMRLYDFISSRSAPPRHALSRVNLVKEALEEKGKPLGVAEIEAYLNTHFASINAVEKQNYKSTSAIISYLLGKGELRRLKNGSYILSIWEAQYATELEEESLRNPKGKVLADVVKMLSEYPNQTVSRRVLWCRLTESGYRASTVNNILLNSPVIEKYEQEGTLYVRLKNDYQSQSKKKQQDQILKSLTDLLLQSKGHQLPLKIIADRVQKQFSLSSTQRPVVYKVISANPHLFEKIDWADGRKAVAMLAAPKPFDVTFDLKEHGVPLRTLLADELRPQLTGIFVHSLEVALDQFFNVAMYETGEADLEALDLLPGFIWKFFSGLADEHFEHSLVREIATSIEPFLSKILYLTAPARYEAYQHEQNRGLARLNYLLSHIQFHHSKRLKQAFLMAKQTRDAAAHTARSWPSEQRKDRVLACLIQMLYSVDCYYAQLNRPQVYATGQDSDTNSCGSAGVSKPNLPYREAVNFP